MQSAVSGKSLLKCMAQQQSVDSAQGGIVLGGINDADSKAIGDLPHSKLSAPVSSVIDLPVAQRRLHPCS